MSSRRSSSQIRDIRAKKYGLSLDQLVEMEEAFSLFDDNGDGEISLKELETIMRSFGMQPSEQELKEMIREVDQDGSGTVDFDEFLEMMRQRVSNSIPEKEVLDSFRLFDKDQDGYLSAEELQNAMRMLGENLNELEVAQMLDDADLDKDGRLSYKEFSWMMQTDPNSLPRLKRKDDLVPEVVETLYSKTMMSE